MRPEVKQSRKIRVRNEVCTEQIPVHLPEGDGDTDSELFLAALVKREAMAVTFHWVIE